MTINSKCVLCLALCILAISCKKKDENTLAGKNGISQAYEVDYNIDSDFMTVSAFFQQYGDNNEYHPYNLKDNGIEANINGMPGVMTDPYRYKWSFDKGMHDLQIELKKGDKKKVTNYFSKNDIQLFDFADMKDTFSISEGISIKWRMTKHNHYGGYRVSVSLRDSSVTDPSHSTFNKLSTDEEGEMIIKNDYSVKILPGPAVVNIMIVTDGAQHLPNGDGEERADINIYTYAMKHIYLKQ